MKNCFTTIVVFLGGFLMVSLASKKSRIGIVLSPAAEGERYNSTRKLLEHTGAFLDIFRFEPIDHQSEELEQWRAKYFPEKAMPTVLSKQKTLSNLASFVKLIIEYAIRAPSQIKWLHLFENDLGISEFYTKKMHHVEKEIHATEIMAQIHGHKIMYSGICLHSLSDAVCHNSTFPWKKSQDCTGYGACAHAYAIFREDANQTVLEILRADAGPDWVYMDVHLQMYSRQKSGVPLAGAEICQGQIYGHCGIFFQDRAKFPSIISSQSVA